MGSERSETDPQPELFDPETGPPQEAAEPDPEPEPDPNAERLVAAERRAEEEREARERAERSLEAALRGGGSRERERPSAPDPGEMPDPVQEPEKFKTWVSAQREFLSEATRQEIEQHTSRLEGRTRAEALMRDFMEENPEFKGLGLDELRLHFVAANRYSDVLPSDTDRLKRDVKSRLEGLRDKLAPRKDDHRTGGTSAGSRAPRPKTKTPDAPPPKPFVDELAEWQETHQL